jgi:hypothetical protein
LSIFNRWSGDLPAFAGIAGESRSAQVLATAATLAGDRGTRSLRGTRQIMAGAPSACPPAINDRRGKEKWRRCAVRVAADSFQVVPARLIGARAATGENRARPILQTRRLIRQPLGAKMLMSRTFQIAPLTPR